LLNLIVVLKILYNYKLEFSLVVSSDTTATVLIVFHRITTDSERKSGQYYNYHRKKLITENVLN